MNYGAVWADSGTNWSEINKICGVSLPNRIVGGTKAELGQFPWIAHLGIKRKFDPMLLTKIVFKAVCVLGFDNGAFILSYECGGTL